MHTFRSALDLFVTTLSAGSAEEMRTLVALGASELARRAPGSTLAIGVRSLLEDARTQSNRRRRHPERRNFAEIAQAAFGVVELGRRAA